MVALGVPIRYSAGMSTITLEYAFAEGVTLDGDPRPHQHELKSRGWRWSRQQQFWYIPHSRGNSVERYQSRIDDTAAALRTHGLEVEVDIKTATPTGDDIAALEADKLERAEGRADYHDTQQARREADADAAFQRAHDATAGIPFGQPILVGHHSERRHRAALERADNAGRKGVEAVETARYHEQRAEAAARTAEGPSADLRRRRIERLEAELRAAERGSRADWYRDEVAAKLDHERAALAELETADPTNRPVDRDDFRKGDVLPRLGATVVRVNAKTLTCQYDVFAHTSITQAIRYTELTVADIPERTDDTPPADPPVKRNHEWVIGDIVDCNWGYDQTNVDFYQVVELNGKTMVTLRPIEKRTNENQRVVPIADKFCGEPFRRKVTPGWQGDGWISINTFSGASRWDGKERYDTICAGDAGH
jgi:hypothetical protein